MTKYGKAAQKKVATAMKRMEKGTLKSGGSGKKVTNPKQAIAIGLSEAEEKRAAKPGKRADMKTTPKKAVTKKAAAKKSTNKKPISSKVAGKKVAATKSDIKKSTASRQAVPVKKSTAKKAAPGEKDISSKVKKNLEPDKMPHLTGINLPPVEEKSDDTKLMVQDRPADPVIAEDKKVLAKTVSKRDPKHPIQLSGPKNTLRPSGKKPLWR